jgi:hypothetical protein
MSKVITIAIVDDSSDLRENIGGYLGAFPEFRCLNVPTPARARRWKSCPKIRPMSS